MVLPHYFYCYRGVTINFLPSPWYYLEIQIFPIYLLRYYRRITAFPITVSLSTVVHKVLKETCRDCWIQARSSSSAQPTVKAVTTTGKSTPLRVGYLSRPTGMFYPIPCTEFCTAHCTMGQNAGNF